MWHKFNIGDLVKIESEIHKNRYGCRFGIITKISGDASGTEAPMYEVFIPERNVHINLMGYELVKIPEQRYSPTTQQIKDDINSIFGLPMTILLNAEQEAYINEDIRRTQEMMDAVGKMIHEKEERKMSMTPKKIMRNGPATIIFWEDGTKTVVKKMPGDKDDIYAAFCAAFAKKHFGSNEKVKAVVDSLCGPSEEEVKRLVDSIQAKYADDFCKGYGVVISKSSLKCDDRTFYEVREKLNEQGYITERAPNCYYNHRWIVKRDDTKHIKWCLEHKSFVEKIVITLTYTGGDSYRMGEIARELAEAGYSVKCLYGNSNHDYIYTIEKIEVNKK